MEILLFLVYVNNLGFKVLSLTFPFPFSLVKGDDTLLDISPLFTRREAYHHLGKQGCYFPYCIETFWLQHAYVLLFI